MEMYPREKKVEAQSRNLSYILITLKKKLKCIVNRFTIE